MKAKQKKAGIVSISSFTRIYSESFSGEVLFAQITNGFPGDIVVRNPTCRCRRCKRLGLNPWIRKIPW